MKVAVEITMWGAHVLFVALVVSSLTSLDLLTGLLALGFFGCLLSWNVLLMIAGHSARKPCLCGDGRTE
jgi:hypothetical protein